MKSRELANLGLQRAHHAAARACVDAAREAGWSREAIRARLGAVRRDPDAHRDDDLFGPLARALRTEPGPAFTPRPDAARWRQWGDDLEPQAVEQMRRACELPVAVRGALMPDAHLGYGLPIGGVLATRNAVIPYAVGVDIACRMKLTVLDLPPTVLRGETERLRRAIETETRFGLGAKFDRPHEHDVLDDDWTVSPVTARGKDKAHAQLGSSGSGNHFVEFGRVTIDTREPDLGLDPGTYVGLLSHSGSRGVGASVASHYSKLAMNRHPELPRELRHLAWLDLDDDAGAEYWAAMELMGRYAAANHALIHRSIARHLGARVIADVENHHNFAWKETHDGETLVVHRKGATPAGKGVLGVIPGSMARPAYVVRGRGAAAALHSASHGAGRVMSRTQAKRTFTWSAVRKQLAAAGVELMSAGLDEVPGVYKDIDTVMSQQRDLVETIARFDPVLVKMAPEGERAED